jgi:glucose-1-phosphate thymidylyltransferase
MLSGIRDILVISTPQDIPRFQILLGDGSQWGLNLQYEIQPSPDGLAQAFLIGEDFLNNGNSALVLGDNLFYGNALVRSLKSAFDSVAGATLFAQHVSDPDRFGVVEFDDNEKVISIEEKPSVPKSNFAVTGLYFYDNKVCDVAKNLTPSPRGELEITDINNFYLNQGLLNVEVLSRGVAWFDTGTHESMIDASNFVATLQKRQGLQVACPEEVAFVMGWISADQLLELSVPLQKNSYGQYLLRLAQGAK